MIHASSMLQWLVDYELTSAARYRRYFSLVLVDPPTGEIDIEKLLGATFRGSDVVFDLVSGVAVFMGETESEGAKHAVERYKSMCVSDCDLRFAVVTYPEDGATAESFLGTACRRLEEARRH